MPIVNTLDDKFWWLTQKMVLVLVMTLMSLNKTFYYNCFTMCYILNHMMAAQCKEES